MTTYATRNGHEVHDYVRGILVDTWHSIAGLVAPTGLPYDKTDRDEFTSITNVGLYFTAIVAARHLDLLDAAEAAERIDLALSGLERFETWNGFQQDWNSVESFRPKPGDQVVSFIDSGNLAAGLITVAEAETGFGSRAMGLLEAMDWSWAYDPVKGLLQGGFDVRTHRMRPRWHLDLLASEDATAVFVAVAMQRVPASAWTLLGRDWQTRDGYTFLSPGLKGGGLFLHCLPGLWLDERGTDLWTSAGNFATWQIEHARRIGSPVWGWSACADPKRGYLGWGKLKDEVVTPHASALALPFVPAEAVRNLKVLEELGCRTPEDGFLDSVNWKSGLVSQEALMLDQGMMLLALANHLDDDHVRKVFQRSPVVREGRQLIPEFREQLDRL